jgi:hypothetical protein
LALETLKDVKEIGGFEIGKSLYVDSDDPTDIQRQWDALRKCIIINEKTNCIAFRLQNGPIKEVGVNGCSIDCLIEAASMIIEGLNKNFPCRENALVITKLEEALLWSMKRKMNREQRGVEGLNKV